MTIRELIEDLSKFNQDLPITITDGCEGITYKPVIPTIVEFEEDDGTISLDIGIGGSRI
jgi:hypothetical protein